MVKHYFFVGTSLPPLEIGSAPEISFEEFEQLLKDNLTHEDYLKTRVIRSFFDMLNFKALLLGDEKIDPYGNLNKLELEESIIVSDRLPPYILDFLRKYEKKEDRLKHVTELLADFFHYELNHTTGFLHRYLAFERNLRLVLLAFRAKQLGRDVAEELQYEDPEEDIIAQILAQKDAKNYEPPSGFEDLHGLFEQNYNSPYAFNQALAEYRFNKIDEMIGFDVFSFDRILGYMLQLITVEKWLELDKEKGLEIVDKIEKGSS